MQKIMFNKPYGLEDAVIEGRKPVTRRAVSDKIMAKAESYQREYFADTLSALTLEDALLEFSPYKVGEVVAVARAYRDIRHIIGDVQDGKSIKFMPGWSNKMFVRADLMPDRIRITNVRVERLQDISDEDCLLEGIVKIPQGFYSFEGWGGKNDQWYATKAREAFAALIDKVSGKGTWERNPWVFVYEFELVK